MNIRPYRVGDRVQLQSGGAPLTVVGYDGWLFKFGYRVAAISPGGLLQETIVDGQALRPYAGRPTASCRTSEMWNA